MIADDSLTDDALSTAIFSITQVRVLEQALMQAQQLSEYDLMQRVGEQMWQQIVRRWPNAQQITVCCGPGNNGGDGYVIARLAIQQYRQVRILTAIPIEQLKGAARLAADAAVQAQVMIERWSDTLPTADLYVDALFGIGLQRDIHSTYHQWITRLNQVSAPVVSVDVPSGIDADTGAVLGVAVKADVTLTALALKIGLFTGNAMDYVGEVQLVCKALAQSQLPSITPLAQRVTRANFLQWPDRPRNAHKGLQGHSIPRSV